MVTEISTLQELQDINNNLSGDYVLTSDIDASETENWNQLNWQGTWESEATYYENDYIEESGNYYYLLQDSHYSGYEFDSSEWIETTEFTGGSEDDGEPLGWRSLGGDFLARFTGSFDGQGYVISDLYINRGIEDSEDFSGVGLFGRTEGSDIQNIGVINTNITGECRAGGLAGYTRNSSTVSNSYSTGTVSGDDRVGGLVGRNRDSTVQNSYATGTVSGDERVGGLVGYNRNSSTVQNSYSTGDVSGNSDVGSLVGRIFNVDGQTDEILYSYANSDINPDLDLIGSTSISGTLDTTGSSLKTTAEMTDYPDYPDAYEGWEFPEIWRTSNNEDQEGNKGYPALFWETIFTPIPQFISSPSFPTATFPS